MVDLPAFRNQLFILLFADRNHRTYWSQPMGQLIECLDEPAPGCVRAVSDAVTSVDGYTRRDEGLRV